MKKILIFICLLALPVNAVHADIYDEIEDMIRQEENAIEEKSNTPQPYMKHSPTFLDDVKCEEIQIYNESLSIHIGKSESLKIDARPMPVNTTNKQMTFSLENNDIAQISEDGTVTPNGVPGTVKVTVTCGEIKKNIEINIIRGAEGVTLSRQDMLFYIDRPITAKLTANVLPSDATNKNVTWSTENSAVASVSEDGTVTPIGTGTTNIVAKTEDGGFTAKCIVYVQVYNIPVRGAFITNAIEAMRINSDYRLTSYIYPQNAREKAVSWHSSNPEIVTVDGNGNLLQYEGGYTDYLEGKERRFGGSAEETAKAAPSKTSADEPAKPKNNDWKQNRPTRLKFTFKEQREYETIDDDIAALEEKIASLDDQMLKNATNSAKLAELMAEKEKTEAALEEKTERWVYLTDLAEQIEAQNQK